MVAEKGRKNERKWRESEKCGRAENFSPKKTLLIKHPLTVSGLGDFVDKAPLQNYKNNFAKPITMGAKKEENQKR